MKFLWALCICLLTKIGLSQNTTRIVALNGSTFEYVAADANGNLMTTSGGSSPAVPVGGYAAPVALTALGPAGTFIYIKADANGNLMTTGGGGGGSYTASLPIRLTGTVFDCPTCTIANGPPVAIVGALADYDFLQGTGTTLTDISGNGNNGTLGTSTNAPTWVTNGLWFSAGTNTGQNVQLPSALNSAKTWCFASYTDTAATSGSFVGPNFQYTFFTTSSLGKAGILLAQTIEIPNVGGYQSVATYAPGVWSNGGIPTGTNALISGFHTVCYTLGTGGGDVDRIYIDGKESTSYTGQGSSAGFQTSGNIYLGGIQGTSLGDNVGFAGTMYRATVFSAELTPTQIGFISGQMQSEVGNRGVPITPKIYPIANPQLWAVGDSITYATGTGGTPYISLMTFANQPAWTLNNYGIPGITLQSIAGQEANRLGPMCAGAQGPAWVMIMAGINDAEKVGGTGSSVTAYMSSEVTLLKALGCHVLVGTLLDAVGQDTFKNAYDTLLLNQIKTMNADGVIDFAANPLMGADGASSNTTYFVDGLHPTSAGDALLATAASNSMNYYFGSNSRNPTIVTGTTHTILSGEGYVTANPASAAQAFTLPDCTGPSGETYTVSNIQSKYAVTVVTGSSAQLINGLPVGTTITVPNGGSVGFVVVPNTKSISGCHWETAPQALRPTSLGFTLNSGAIKTDAAPRQIGDHTATISTCQFLTTASDGAVGLAFDIKDNGTTIFSSTPTVTAGTSAGTLSAVGTLTSTPTTITKNHSYSINVTGGSSSWIGAVLCN